MLKFGEYDFHASLINLKRLNRIYPNFYDFDNNTYNSPIVENCEELTKKLLQKYSPLTVLKTLEFIIVFLQANGVPEHITGTYDEAISDLIDMKNNPYDYLKIASFENLRETINSWYPVFMSNGVSFTNFRNFMFLAFLIFEVPLKLHHLIFVEYVRNKQPHECLTSPIYMLHDIPTNTFQLILNKRKNKKLVKQFSYKLRSPVIKKILLKYISSYRKVNQNLLFTSASGRVLKKSNISNGIMNFTYKLCDVPITIHDLRKVYSKMNDYENYKEIFDY